MCNQNDNNGLGELLEKILLLQQVTHQNTNEGCTKPILGDITNVIANTRPITLYCCCNNTNWSMPYNYNGSTGNSNVFRIENINEDTATFRILIQNEDNYTATNNFFTIRLKYISCIKCLPDTLIENI